MRKQLFLFMGGAAVLGLFSFQLAMINDLRSEIATIRVELETAVPSDSSASPSPFPRSAPQRVSLNVPADLENRLALLEVAIQDLTNATEVLRQRGTLPLNEANIAAYKARFSDLNASDRDRLSAYRLLRRAGQFSDDMAHSALSWLQTATNANTRRELVRALDGSTNTAVKQPLLSLLTTEESSRVREEIVDSLGAFASDPAVENELWRLSESDPDRRVRERALRELAGENLSAPRVAALQERALNGETPLDDRLMAFQALRRSGVEAPGVLQSMVEIASSAEDPVARARVFSALDGVRDESLKVPLVYGLQDPNPVVREQAADALGHFANTDPQVREWLAYISQNDADPRVQREAHRALSGGRRGR